MRFSWICWAAMTLGGSVLLFTRDVPASTGVSADARLAIYYGYPSLVNGANGDIDKAASVFSTYDVVVLGDGLEFPDTRSDRYPPGDPAEHQKVLRMISAVRDRRSGTRFYGYVCLGEMPSPHQKKTFLTPNQLEERVNLWRDMGVTGIFLDEAGYDFAVVTRERQNMAVSIIHKLGLSAFVNAYFLDHLFSLEDKLPNADGDAKNPQHLPPLLDHRDLFLLESFQVRNGSYEGVSEWQGRLNQALKYRQAYGARIFAITTSTDQEPFSEEKFNFALWTARLYGLDGFGWGEPNFAAVSNALPDRRCSWEASMVARFEAATAVGSDSTRFWRKAGDYLVVGDTVTHSVYRVRFKGVPEPKNSAALFTSRGRGSLLACRGSS